MSNKNKSKLIKRLITGAMCLTLVFSINGFASVVSDNDGSAFITKAEFDSLKNNFQSQIDQYNQSIDSKIDGAIAAYLSGIKTTILLNLDNLYAKVTASDPLYSKFVNPNGTHFQLAEDRMYGKACSYYLSARNSTPNRVANIGVSFYRISSWSHVGGPNDYTTFGTENKYYLFDVSDSITDNTNDTGKAIFLSDTKLHTSMVEILNMDANYMIAAPIQFATQADFDASFEKNHTIDINNKDKYPGIFKNCEETKCFNLTVIPQTTLSEQWTEQANSNPTAGYLTGGAVSSQAMKLIMKENMNLFDSDTQKTTNHSGEKAYQSYAGGKATSMWYDATTTYPITAYTQNITKGFSGDYTSGFTYVYKYYFHKVFDVNEDKLSYKPASEVVQAPVRYYQGLPLTTVKEKGTIKLKATVNNTEGWQTWLQISNVPFKNENFYQTDPYGSYDHILYSEKLVSGTAINVSFMVDNIIDQVKGDTLWFRLTDSHGSTTSIMDLTIDGNITEKLED